MENVTVHPGEALPWVHPTTARDRENLRISCHSFHVFNDLIQRRVITATNKSLI